MSPSTRIPPTTLSRIARLVPAHIRRLKSDSELVNSTQQSQSHPPHPISIPQWQQPATQFFTLWPKLSVCAPKFQEFIAKCDAKDLKQPHIFMNDDAGSELVEFYLCCSLLTRPEEVEKVKNDNDKLLELAHTVAKQDIEPVLESAQKLGLEYCEPTHRIMESLTVWKEIDEGLFWHHSFRRLCPNEYWEFMKALGIFGNSNGITSESEDLLHLELSIKDQAMKHLERKEKVKAEEVAKILGDKTPVGVLTNAGQNVIQQNNDNINQSTIAISQLLGDTDDSDLYANYGKLSQEFEEYIERQNQKENEKNGKKCGSSDSEGQDSNSSKDQQQGSDSQSDNVTGSEDILSKLPFSQPSIQVFPDLPLDDFLNPNSKFSNNIDDEKSHQLRIEKAEILYKTWLDLAGMPIRGTIRNVLLDHQFLSWLPRAWEGPENVRFKQSSSSGSGDGSTKGKSGSIKAKEHEF